MPALPATREPSAFYRDRAIVRWGIIGCGDVTEKKSGPAFQKAAGSRLVAVMRRDAGRAADYARRHGVPRWYADAAQLAADPEVDAVYVATPPDAHLDGALLAAAAGKPAYVEKPMARHTAECDRMITAFATARLPLFVAYYRRALPRFTLVQELLAQGEIGTVTAVSHALTEPFHCRDAGWRTEVAIAGGGHFLDLGSHALDLIDWLLGPIGEVSGTAANRASAGAAEDTVAMAFRTASGAVGSALWDFAAGIRRDSLRLEGTEGAIEFSVFENAPVRIETAAGVRTIIRDHPPHVQQPMVQSVVDDLLGHGACVSTGESARRTSAVMAAALAGYSGGRGDAFWTRAECWPGRGRKGNA
ncbi:MAG: Gfo/Idh/MocA family oxidoreductase [Opitutaceae bacterium]|nr:Gfo/Idh/MocA family oxidoreductase [Opitutaceae bacterium]